MILLKSLIVLLLALIIAQIYKSGWGREKNREGFQETTDLYPLVQGEDISYELSASSAPTIATPTIATPTIATPTIAESASQKAQAKALTEKTNEEDKTIADHKRALNNSFDMSEVEDQIKELIHLSDQAKEITVDM
jgi:hypothetical protein